MENCYSSRQRCSLSQSLGFSSTGASQVLRRQNESASTNIRQKPMMTVTPATPPAAKLKWRCMKDCGACCKIGDYDADVLRGMLKNEKDVTEYVSMIGEDGWCRHFNTTVRNCTIYEDRPRFCRVSSEVFKDLYDVEEEDMDEFAIDCCIDQIGEIYGTESKEVDTFALLVGVGARVKQSGEPLTQVVRMDEHEEKCAEP